MTSKIFSTAFLKSVKPLLTLSFFAFLNTKKFKSAIRSALNVQTDSGVIVRIKDNDEYVIDDYESGYLKVSENKFNNEDLALAKNSFENVMYMQKLLSTPLGYVQLLMFMEKDGKKNIKLNFNQPTFKGIDDYVEELNANHLSLNYMTILNTYNENVEKI